MLERVYLYSYDNWYFECKNNKFNVKDIYMMLGYDLIDEDYYVSKEELINDYLTEEDQDFIDFLNEIFL